MERGPSLWILGIQAIVLGAAGIALVAVPGEAGGAWPWELPPLSARIVGAAFLGVAAAAATVAVWRQPRGLRALAVMGLGTLLVPVAAIVTPGVEVDGPRLAILTLVLATCAVADVWLWRNAPVSGGWGHLSRPFLAYFAIHLALVVVVGAALFVAPTTMADVAPWELSPVNIRLLSGIILASALLSALALRDRDWAAVYPTAVSFATFTTLATIAMFVHFGLFDPDRLRTWVFLGTYVVAALAAIVAVVRSAKARDQARREGA